MEKEKVDLGKLLGQLTVEGRAEAVYQLTVHSFENVNEAKVCKYVDEAINYFKNKLPEKAALIAEGHGYLEEATLLYLKAGSQDKAMRTARIAIVQYEVQLEFQNAATLAEKLEMYDVAAVNFEKAGLFKEAAQAAERCGLKDKANVYQTIDGLLDRNL